MTEQEELDALELELLELELASYDEEPIQEEATDVSYTEEGFFDNAGDINLADTETAVESTLISQFGGALSGAGRYLRPDLADEEVGPVEALWDKGADWAGSKLIETGEDLKGSARALDTTISEETLEARRKYNASKGVSGMTALSLADTVSQGVGSVLAFGPGMAMGLGKGLAYMGTLAGTSMAEEARDETVQLISDIPDEALRSNTGFKEYLKNSDSFNDAKEAFITDLSHTRANISGGVGVLTAPVYRILGMAAGGKLFKFRPLNIAAGGGIEGAQEVGENLPGDFYLNAEVPEAELDIVDRSIKNFVAGAGAGGAMATPTAVGQMAITDPLQAYTDRKADKLQAEVDAADAANQAILNDVGDANIDVDNTGLSYADLENIYSPYNEDMITEPVSRVQTATKYDDTFTDEEQMLFEDSAALYRDMENLSDAEAETKAYDHIKTKRGTEEILDYNDIVEEVKTKTPTKPADVVKETEEAIKVEDREVAAESATDGVKAAVVNVEAKTAEVEKEPANTTKQAELVQAKATLKKARAVQRKQVKKAKVEVAKEEVESIKKTSKEYIDKEQLKPLDTVKIKGKRGDIELVSTDLERGTAVVQKVTQIQDAEGNIEFEAIPNSQQEVELTSIKKAVEKTRKTKPKPLTKKETQQANLDDILSAAMKPIIEPPVVPIKEVTPPTPTPTITEEDKAVKAAEIKRQIEEEAKTATEKELESFGELEYDEGERVFLDDFGDAVRLTPAQKKVWFDQHPEIERPTREKAKAKKKAKATADIKSGVYEEVVDEDGDVSTVELNAEEAFEDIANRMDKIENLRNCILS